MLTPIEKVHRCAHRTLLTAFAILPAAALVLAGCSGSSASSASDDDTIRIVASTNVYGDIAETIGGDAVDGHQLIDGAAQDPHSYEADARRTSSRSRRPTS